MNTAITRECFLGASGLRPDRAIRSNLARPGTGAQVFPLLSLARKRAQYRGGRLLFFFGIAVGLSLFFAACPQPGGETGWTGDAVPAAPAAPDIKPGNRRLILSWEAVPGAASYDVCYGEAEPAAGDSTEKTLNVPAPAALLSGLENGIRYYVKVRAKNRAGASGFSPPAEETPAVQTPSPSLIRGDASLLVGWPAEDGVTYEVWYGTTSESGAAAQWHGAINRPETGVTAGTAITGLANGTPCYVWIKTEAAGFGEKTAGTPEAPPASVGGDFVYVPGGTVTGSADYAFTVKVPDNAAYNNPGSSSVQKGVFVEDRRIEEMGSFVMAKHETTRQLWYTVQEWARQNGYAFQNTINAPSLANENKPVANISWRDAIIWCNAYSEMTEGGLEPVYRDSGGNVLKDSTDAAACDAAIMDKNKTGYRLPTEVEREFAARGGDPGRADWMYMYAGSDDAEDVAWHHGNSGTTQAVGEKDPNRLGIYDLSGNVQEWCGDWMHWARDVTRETPVDGADYHPTSANQKAFNGGGAGSNPTMSCVAYRWGYPPNYKDSYVGFRVVRKP